MSDLSDRLAALGATPADEPATQSGRGPSGKLRNFAQMSEAKFKGTLAAIRAEDNDPEALAEINAEAERRGL